MNKIEEEQQKIEAVSKIIKKMDTSAFIVHTMAVDEALKHLKTDRKGLTSAAAARRLEEVGPNELEGEEEKSLWARIAE